MPDLFETAAEPNRRRLLQLPGRAERSVSELADNFPVSRSAISQHLLVLADLGLVQARKHGRRRYQSLNTQGMSRLWESLATFWTTEPELLRRWQTVAARVDLRVGGEYRRTITPGHSAVGTFTEDEPGKRVFFTWGRQASGADASTVTIILEPAESGTTVRLIHEGLGNEAAAMEAFNARGLDGTIDMGFAELPATTVANVLNLEFLVHAWDFATAKGKTLEVSPVLSDYVLGLARNTSVPSMRGESFATETIAGESAGSLDRLVAFTGRQSAGV